VTFSTYAIDMAPHAEEQGRSRAPVDAKCLKSACRVEVQLVGDRRNTRVEQRILHLDIAAAAVKLVSHRLLQNACSRMYG
jgi:hypothetical protein